MTETLRDGYDRRKAIHREAEFRPMTVAEAKQLGYGQHVLAHDLNGTVRTVKVNGTPKTWKRSPGVEVPWKYGLYEYGREGSKELQPSDPVGILLVQESDWREVSP